MPDFIVGRQALITALREELVGPCPRGKEIDCEGQVTFPDRESAYGPWRQAGSGEEILDRDRPIKRYGVGVLYPPETPGERDPGQGGEASGATEDEVPAGEATDVLADAGAVDIERIAERQGGGDRDESDFDLSTANSYRPSAAGLSFVCRAHEGSRLRVSLRAGRYLTKQITIRAAEADGEGAKEAEGRRCSPAGGGSAGPCHSRQRSPQPTSQLGRQGWFRRIEIRKARTLMASPLVSWPMQDRVRTGRRWLRCQS